MLHAVDICDIKFLEDKCVTHTYKKLKQTKLGTHIKLMVFKSFTCDPKLCVIINLKAYLGKSKAFQKGYRIIS